MIFPFSPDKFSDEDIDCPELGHEKKYYLDYKRGIKLIENIEKLRRKKRKISKEKEKQ